MFGIPYMSYDMCTPLPPSMGSGYGSTLSGNGLGLAAPKLNSLHRDCFASRAKCCDKRNINLGYVALFLAGVAASILAGAKGLASVGKLSKDASSEVASNVAYGAKVAKNYTKKCVCKFFSFLNPVNWFKKSK